MRNPRQTFCPGKWLASHAQLTSVRCNRFQMAFGNHVFKILLFSFFNITVVKLKGKCTECVNIFLFNMRTICPIYYAKFLYTMYRYRVNVQCGYKYCITLFFTHWGKGAVSRRSCWCGVKITLKLCSLSRERNAHSMTKVNQSQSLKEEGALYINTFSPILA